jgi:serine/threonine protein kinase
MSQGSTGAATSSGGHGSERKDNRTGATVCGWSLERLLGLGPTCESWLAAKKGAPAAVVRVLRDPFANDPRARAEWLGASWAANRFSHACVPRVMQDGADGRGAPVVIRAWASGQSLDRIVRGGGIAPKLALQLAEQVLDALEMAHAHGIVHGALSPPNVVVTERGTVRVLDFATAPGRLAGAAEALLRTRISPYMAPRERAALSETDLRATLSPPTEQADIWSVGACLYFAIAGDAPPLEAPSLRRVVPDTEADVVAVVDRALAIDQAERYESAYAMLGDIRRVLSGRRPSLHSIPAALPSQSAGDLQGYPESESGVLGLDPATGAARRTDAARPGEGGSPPNEWLGNLLLFAAIALMVALASFVLVRERLADRQAEPPPPALHDR